MQYLDNHFSNTYLSLLNEEENHCDEETSSPLSWVIGMCYYITHATRSEDWVIRLMCEIYFGKKLGSTYNLYNSKLNLKLISSFQTDKRSKKS